MQSELSSMSESFCNIFPLLGSTGWYIHQVWGPSGPPNSVLLNLNNPIPLAWSKCLIHCRIEALVYLCCWPEGHNTPPPFSQDVLKNVYAKSTSWIWQRITSLCPKDLHLTNAFIDFQWSMQDLGCLVNITNFDFLCRKLSFVHVGIVQNSIFFIKSARRFRKTISTLANQRVVCVSGIPRPMTVHFWIWELWMMWKEMHGWQTWSKR